MPPVTATLKFVALPAHIVALPVKTDDDGPDTACEFNGCAEGAVTVKQEPQIVVPDEPVC